MKRFLAVLVLLWPMTARAQVIVPSPQSLTAQYSSACAATTCATWAVGTATSLTISVSGAGSWTATFLASSDGGKTYFTATMVKLEDRSNATTVSNTGDGQYAITNSGLTHVQVRMTTWASGGADVWAIRGYGSLMALPFGYGSLTVGSTTITGGSNGLTLYDNNGVLGETQNLQTTGTPTFAGVTNSALTATRVVIAGTAGLLEDDAGLTYVKATDALTLTGPLAVTFATGNANATITSSTAANYAYFDLVTNGSVFEIGRNGTTANALLGSTAAGGAVFNQVSNFPIYFGVNNILRATLTAADFTLTVPVVSPVLQGSGTGVSVANVGANSCGTTAATIAGNQVSGKITVGATAGTQCRVTFSTAAPVSRDCTVTDETTTIATRATFVSTTTHDFFGAFVAGDVVTYICTVR